jgi:hypothetical protein
MKVLVATDGQIMFTCPGCGTTHGVPTLGEIAWTYNGNSELPTVNPSIIIHGSGNVRRCHSIVRNGKIMFLSDSDHHLAGKTVTLPEM